MTTGITPSTVDLVDLNSCKDYLGVKPDNHDDDSAIAAAITAFSQYVINQTGISSFNTVGTYSEIYDGNGRDRLFLNNRPIVTVTSITVGASQIPQSTGLTASGWFIEQSKKSIAIRSGSLSTAVAGFTSAYCFAQGVGNIQVDYTAGYTRVPTDLVDAVMKAVAQRRRRKDWIDLASKSMGASGASGSTMYHKWNLPPEITEIIDNYSRYARP